jgi:hypothetical protein
MNIFGSDNYYQCIIDTQIERKEKRSKERKHKNMKNNKPKKMKIERRKNEMKSEGENKNLFMFYFAIKPLRHYIIL